MPSGRLTLSWAHKGDSLVIDADGDYAWVPPDDVRAREIRLLDEVSTHGDGADNLLIRGDSLDALRALAHIPEYAERHRGKVKLAYIDPPFNTGQAFEHYDDGLEHSVWLGLMRERLLAIKELLAPDGSVWVHLDDAEMHYAKVLMDEIFGRANFVATVVWQKTHTRENRTAISTSNDSILIYAPLGDLWKAVRNVLPSSEAQIARYTNPDDDPRGPWQSTPMHAKAEKGRRAEQFYAIETPNGRLVDPPPGRCWLFTRPRYEELLADNRISFGSGDGVPRIKKFLAEVQEGLVPSTWWTHQEVGTTGTGKAEVVALFPGEIPFSTPKPERLLERIIHIGSNPGDLVLDAFAGSGTTAAVAHKTGRRWVTIERNEATVDAFTRPRLAKVVDGADPGGVTESAGWTGGGGFAELRIAPSAYRVTATPEFTSIGVPAETDGATLARSVAAQLGHAFAPVPGSLLVGRKGRARLAVVNGVADEALVEGLVTELDDGETLTLATTMAAPGTAQALRERSRGGRILLIPHDLFPQGGAIA